MSGGASFFADARHAVSAARHASRSGGACHVPSLGTLWDSLGGDFGELRLNAMHSELFGVG